MSKITYPKTTFLKGKNDISLLVIRQEKTEVYVLRKGVNLSSESSQLYSDETVNQIRTGRQEISVISVNFEWGY